MLVIIYYMSENIMQFKDGENMNILWEVLLDEFQITNKDTNMVSNMRTVFESNINPFTNSMKYNNSINLVNMNKQFLSQVFMAINNLFPNFQQIKQIQISDEEINEPYNVVDIKNARQNEFEKQLNQKRNEFEDSIALKKPKDVDFSVKYKDEKITEMDNLIKETMLERNFEINTIHNGYAVNSKTTEWLNVEDSPTIKNATDIKKNETTVKTVNWDETDITTSNQTPKQNIFSKLKKTENNIITPSPNISSYAEEFRQLTTKIDAIYEMLQKLLIQQDQTNKNLEI